MNVKSYELALAALSEARSKFQKNMKAEVESMKVKGEIIKSEKDLYEMLEADLFDSDRYYDLLEKFRKINEDNFNNQKDLKDAYDYLGKIYFYAYQELLEFKEKEDKLHGNKGS